MAEFEVWHVLPPGEMPTVRQVLECGGGRWILIDGRDGYMTDTWVVIGADGRVAGEIDAGDRLVCIAPSPIQTHIPAPEVVGESSRWRILCAHKPEGDACTLRTVDGRVEALFDGDDQWVPLASQWGVGMVAVREGDR